MPESSRLVVQEVVLSAHLVFYLRVLGMSAEGLDQIGRAFFYFEFNTSLKLKTFSRN